MKKFLLLTGASSGIGRQCAIQLSKDYNLILCARRENKLLETKYMCENSDKHLIFPCDLSDIENIENALINFIKEKEIVIDKFLHCAGTIGMQPLKVVTADFMLKCFKINLISAQLIVKVLISKKYNNRALNNIVFISSMNSIMGDKAFSVYAASKAGLDGLMRSLAVELAPRVRINSILPGLLNSGMASRLDGDTDLINKIEKGYLLGIGKPQNIAEVAEFLLSEKSSWITGQQIVVDGGRSINASS